MATLNTNSITFSTATLQGASGSAPMYMARGWFCYNSNSQTLLSSANVSSVTYNGTGDLQMNFSTALPNSNYALFQLGTLQPADAFAFDGSAVTAKTTSSCRCYFGKWFGRGAQNLPFNSAVVVST